MTSTWFRVAPALALLWLGGGEAAAQWAVLASDLRPREPSHLFQVFSEDDWERYARCASGEHSQVP